MGYLNTHSFRTLAYRSPSSPRPLGFGSPSASPSPLDWQKIGRRFKRSPGGVSRFSGGSRMTTHTKAGSVAPSVVSSVTNIRDLHIRTQLQISQVRKDYIKSYNALETTSKFLQQQLSKTSGEKETLMAAYNEQQKVVAGLQERLADLEELQKSVEPLAEQIAILQRHLDDSQDATPQILDRTSGLVNAIARISAFASQVMAGSLKLSDEEAVAAFLDSDNILDSVKPFDGYGHAETFTDMMADVSFGDPKNIVKRVHGFLRTEFGLGASQGEFVKVLSSLITVFDAVQGVLATEVDDRDYSALDLETLLGNNPKRLFPSILKSVGQSHPSVCLSVDDLTSTKSSVALYQKSTFNAIGHQLVRFFFVVTGMISEEKRLGDLLDEIETLNCPKVMTVPYLEMDEKYFDTIWDHLGITYFGYEPPTTDQLLDGIHRLLGVYVAVVEANASNDYSGLAKAVSDARASSESGGAVVSKQSPLRLTPKRPTFVSPVGKLNLGDDTSELKGGSSSSSVGPSRPVFAVSQNAAAGSSGKSELQRLQEHHTGLVKLYSEIQSALGNYMGYYTCFGRAPYGIGSTQELLAWHSGYLTFLNSDQPFETFRLSREGQNVLNDAFAEGHSAEMFIRGYNDSQAMSNPFVAFGDEKTAKQLAESGMPVSLEMTRSKELAEYIDHKLCHPMTFGDTVDLRLWEAGYRLAMSQYTTSGVFSTTYHSTAVPISSIHCGEVQDIDSGYYQKNADAIAAYQRHAQLATHRVLNDSVLAKLASSVSKDYLEAAIASSLKSTLDLLAGNETVCTAISTGESASEAIASELFAGQFGNRAGNSVRSLLEDTLTIAGVSHSSRNSIVSSLVTALGNGLRLTQQKLCTILCAQLDGVQKDATASAAQLSQNDDESEPEFKKRQLTHILSAMTQCISSSAFASVSVTYISQYISRTIQDFTKVNDANKLVLFDETCLSTIRGLIDYRHQIVLAGYESGMVVRPPKWYAHNFARFTAHGVQVELIRRVDDERGKAKELEENQAKMAAEMQRLREENARLRELVSASSKGSESSNSAYNGAGSSSSGTAE